MAMSLACTHMKMSPAEAIAAATINGAWALRIADRKGSIEPGKDADLAIFSRQRIIARSLLVWGKPVFNDHFERRRGKTRMNICWMGFV